MPFYLSIILFAFLFLDFYIWLALMNDMRLIHKYKRCNFKLYIIYYR